MKETVAHVVQYGIKPIASKEDFWRRVEAQIRQAQKEGSSFVLFPEYLTGHLLALVPAMDHDEACRYLDEHTGEYLSAFRRFSRDTGMIILGGTHIIREGGCFYNTAFLFFPDGRVEKQAKVHLTPEERRAWKLSAGDQFQVFDTPLGRLAILICYDIEFPEAARQVADEGATIILCPSYTDGADGYWRVRHCCQARAIENQVYVALSGIVGKLPQVPQMDAGWCRAGFFAPCDYPFPDDGVLALGRTNVHMSVRGVLSPERLQENRESGKVAPFFDRRR
ncbi:acyltransferase [Heliobacterium undosum]|uniref:Acyltransferase n=1 Tax=Heliomicrobium undosum TaxID=121734 RepID=A0A845L114_9FIRM|nr:carbon-nitrogen hydrolase family protein [Heliomicrobium undosum]MZP28635.1 acyltransferase [Heliomicrobium undosum]